MVWITFFTLIKTPKGRNCYHFYFTDKKAEAKGVKQLLKACESAGNF